MRGGMALVAARYGVPAERGRRVTFRGEPGRIVSATTGQYIWLRMDTGERVGPCHPTWEMDYNPPASSPEVPR